MSVTLQGRHFLSMLDFSTEEILEVLATAKRLKADLRAARSRGAGAAPGSGRAGNAVAGEHPFPAPLRGKTLAMIFQKPSLRTRVSFETGMTQLGGHAIYLAPTDISLGKRESTEDIAQVLSRYADLIMARVFGHDIVVDLAKHSGVPVINGLSDYEHPCQILADFQTIIERKGTLKGVKACYIGDGNNVAHSLMLGAARVGMHMTTITPKGYEPAPKVTQLAEGAARATGSKIVVAHELTAVKGADVVYTDVWASMGQEAEAEARKKIFVKYRIDAETMKLADKGAVILHCLPAHYGDEIDYATSRTPNSAIFDQAENRLHAQKALMVHLAGCA